jgi:hypothetical protein
MIYWQPTELSIIDEDGNYIEDRGAGIAWSLTIDMTEFLPGEEGDPVTVDSATAKLWRRLNPPEIRTVTQARKVQVGADIVAGVGGTIVTVALPALEAGNFYQVEIISISGGVAWTRTREVRCPE